MTSADLILKNANQVITLAGTSDRPLKGIDTNTLNIIEGGDVAVKDGLILEVGKDLQIGSDKVIDCTGKTVMPGFVDPHTHLIFAGSRENELGMKLEGKTYLEILAAGGGIQRSMGATRKADKAQLMTEAKKRLDTMLLFGTTTVEAKSGYGLNRDHEIKILEVIQALDETHPIDLIPTFMGAHSIPPEHKGNPDGFIDLMISMLPGISEMKLAEFCDIFCEKNVFTREQSERLLRAAQEHGLGAKIHADEIENLGGSDLAAEIGAISAEHLAVTNDMQMKKMGDAGVIGVLLPGTPYALMEEHYPRARAMIENGMALALATDLNPNCWTESMQFIISLACYNLKMTPEEAVVGATINAAHAINRSRVVGSIEAGKQADIIVLDIPNYEHLPYHFGVNHVETVIKKGDIVVYDSRPVF
ncbi:MAG: imidazolonepropionase [Thermoplasmata archaeon]|nr:imidazolonepropionase [Thermoplasmata archaeon]